LSAQLLEANHEFLKLLSYLKSKLTESLIQDYTIRYKKRCEEYVFKHKMTVNHLGLSDEDNPLELYERMASKR